MTPERINRLHGYAEASAGIGIPFIYADGILRVIEERDTLLNAARGARDILERLGGMETLPARSGLSAAISRAEEP